MALFFTSDTYTNVLKIFLTLLIVLIVYHKLIFTYWKRKGVQHPSPTIPFGNGFDLFRRKLPLGIVFKNVYQEFKSKGLRYCGFYILSRPVLVLIELDLIRTITTKDFQHFTDHGNYVNEKKDPLTGNLFGLKGLKWKNLRAKLTPTFTSGKMKLMFQTLVDCSGGLLEVMDGTVEKKDALDIKDVVGRYTTDIIGSCAFGLNCDSLKDPNSEFRKYGKKLLEFTKLQVVIRILSISFPRLLDFLNIKVIQKDVSDFFTNIVKQTVEYREKNNIARKDFMHLLIQLKNNINIKDEDEIGKLRDSNKTNKALTMNELTAQAFVFFIAGFETSSTTLTFCFYELVTNIEVQGKLRQEINDVLAKHEGKITYEAIMEMIYMDKCIQETLRKYPPVPFLIRECTKTYQIPDSDVIVEKGTRVFVPILGIQNDPEHYPDPEKFDPERFTPENKSKQHPFSWLPFGEGPRACIGLRFGLMQTKVALTVLLQNYKFTLNSKTLTPITLSPQSAVLNIEGGLWLNAEKVSVK